jgi:intracellular septation protein
MTKNHKFLLDLAPLAAFFIGYKLGDLMLATMLIIGVTLACLAIHYVLERKIAISPLITGVVVTVFGGLTLWLNDEHFIKIKPTIINLLFAATLLIGAYGFKRGLLKYLFEMAFSLSDKGWRTLSIRWGFFFMFLAVLNEIIWRNFPTDFWVSFKVFGMLTCTILFTIAQIPLIKRYQTDTE